MKKYLIGVVVALVLACAVADIGINLCDWFPSLCPVAGGGGSGAGD